MKNLRAKISICIMIMICFLLATRCSNSSYRERVARQSQCIPPPFLTTESLNSIEERYKLVNIDKPIQEISAYYLDLLTPVDSASPAGWSNGQWRIQELTEPYSGKLFDCYNSEGLGWQTAETGCIFLHMTGEEESIIEYTWNLGEIAPGCASQLKE